MVFSKCKKWARTFCHALLFPRNITCLFLVWSCMLDHVFRAGNRHGCEKSCNALTKNLFRVLKHCRLSRIVCCCNKYFQNLFSLDWSVHTNTYALSFIAFYFFASWYTVLEWHYVITGPVDTPYHNGLYHGKIKV